MRRTQSGEHQRANYRLRRSVIRRAYVAAALCSAGGLVLAGCSSSGNASSSSTAGASSSAGATSTAGNAAASSSSPVATASGAAASAASTADPVQVGILYTDDNPIGTSPEILAAANAAATYINAHGGIGGRAVKIVACDGQNNAQSDARCAAQFVNSGIVTVYGLDGLWGGIGVSIIGKAGIVNQTLPISGPEFTAPNAYPWEGSGITGSYAAAAYAAENKDSGTCAYVDVAAFQQQCDQYFLPAAKALGVSTSTVSIPADANDMSPYATKLSSGGAKVALVTAGGQVPEELVNDSAQIGYDPTWILPTQQPDFFKAVGSHAKGLIFYNDLKDGSDTADPDSALFDSVMKQYAPTAAIDAFSIMAFSNLMTLKALGDQVGGSKITRQNMPALLSKIDVQQFMGPMLNYKVHLPGAPHAVHTGAYLYEWNGSALQLAGKGYYEVTG